MVTIVGDLYLDLRTATDQRLVVEVGLARAAMPEASLDAEALWPGSSGWSAGSRSRAVRA